MSFLPDELWRWNFNHISASHQVLCSYLPHTLLLVNKSHAYLWGASIIRVVDHLRKESTSFKKIKSQFKMSGFLDPCSESLDCRNMWCLFSSKAVGCGLWHYILGKECLVMEREFWGRLTFFSKFLRQLEHELALT